MQVGAGRIVIAFLAFLPLFFVYFKRIDWSKFWPLLFVGICGSGIPAFLYAMGQTKIPSGVTGVLNSMTPIFTLLLAILFFKKPFIPKQLSGILLGFVGVCFVFFVKDQTQQVFPIIFVGLIILATICYGISANVVSGFLTSIKPIIISTVSFVLIGPFVSIYLFTSDFIEVAMTHEHGISSLLALLVLSLVCTFSANILFFRLIQITDAIFSTTVSYLIPLVALIWAFFDGEFISIFHFISLILILAGIFLVKSSTKTAKA